MLLLKWTQKLCFGYLICICSASHAVTSHDFFATTLSILGYVQWSNAHPQLCVVNHTESTSTFKKLIDLHHYPYRVVNVSTQPPSFCDAIFFSDLSPQQEQKILSHASMPLLSISANNRDCEVGSAFCLYQRNQRTSFKVNMQSLTRSKIHIDPRVLLLSKAMELK